MKYIYHYHMMTQCKNGSIDHHIGALERTAMIESVDEYRNAVVFLCKTHKTNPDNTIVTSLTLLNPPKP